MICIMILTPNKKPRFQKKNWDEEDKDMIVNEILIVIKTFCNNFLHYKSFFGKELDEQNVFLNLYTTCLNRILIPTDGI